MTHVDAKYEIGPRSKVGLPKTKYHSNELVPLTPDLLIARINMSLAFTEKLNPWDLDKAKKKAKKKIDWYFFRLKVNLASSTRKTSSRGG